MNLKKLDGSFNIEVNGMPYNTIKSDKYFKETEKLYKKSPELFEIEKEIVIDIKVLQEQKLLENNEKCSAYILSVYPYYKQLNIINPLSDYSIEDRTAMNEFIDMQRAKNKEYKKQILAEEIKLKEDLDKIIIKYGE